MASLQERITILSSLSYFYNSFTTKMGVGESNPKSTKIDLEERLSLKYPLLKDKVLATNEIKTYIELKSLFKDDSEILKIRQKLAKIYTEHILPHILSKKPTEQHLKMIDTALNKENICNYIKKTKLSDSQIRTYADNLGISFPQNTPNSFVCFMIVADITSPISNKYLRIIRKFLNPNRSIVPTESSKLTPQQIADKFKQKRGFRGPINGFTLVPKESFSQLLGRKPPVFLLLGDSHNVPKSVSVKGLNSNNSLLSLRRTDPTLYQELANLSRSENLQIDLFLESWQSQSSRHWNSEISITEKHDASTIRESKAMMFPCYANRKDKPHETCLFPEFRTHPANPRDTNDENDKRPLDGVIQLIEDTLENNITKGISEKEKLEKIKETMEFFKTTLEDRFNKFNKPGEDKVTIIKILEELKELCKPDIENGLDHFFTSPFFNKYSRTKHQFNQLPEQIKPNIMKKMKSVYSFMKCDNKHKNSFGFLLNEMLEYYNCTPIKRCSSENMNLKLFNIHSLCIVQSTWRTKFGSMIMDLYNISRALKIPKDGEPSELSVMYQGSNHITRMIDVLSEFYDVDKQWGRYSDYKSISGSKYISRDITQSDMWNPFEYKIKSNINLNIPKIWKTEPNHCGVLVDIYININKIKNKDIPLEEKNKEIIEFLKINKICNKVSHFKNKDDTLKQLGYDIPNFYPEEFKCYAIMSNLLEQVVKPILDELYSKIKQLGENSSSSKKNGLFLQADLCKYLRKDNRLMSRQEITELAESMGLYETNIAYVCYAILGAIFDPLNKLDEEEKREKQNLKDKNSNSDKPYLDHPDNKNTVEEIAALDPPKPIKTDILYSLKITDGETIYDEPITSDHILNLKKYKGWCLNVPNLFRDINEGDNNFLEMEYTMEPSVNNEQISMRYTLSSSNLPKLTSLLQQINEDSLPSITINKCTNLPYSTQTKTVFQVPNNFSTYIMTESHCVLAE